MKHTKRTGAALLLAACLLSGGCAPAGTPDIPESTAQTAPSEPAQKSETGYISTRSLEAAYGDADGIMLGTLPRGTRIEYITEPDGRTAILWDGQRVYLLDGQAQIVSDPADIIPRHTLYVRTAVNLRDQDGRLLPALADRGTVVEVAGYDRLTETGEAHMYRVICGGEEGYISPWYLTEQESEALSAVDAVHANRPDRYGGGSAADLDYHPREKGPIEGNDMPSECRTLYLVSWRLDEVDAYLEIAEKSGLNAFVVDIVDGGSVGYAGDVMKAYCPTGAEAAHNTVEEYQSSIRKLRDAGYYVIGRITTFNDIYFVQDHPEYAIADTSGKPRKLSGTYWPSPYCRDAWQYKVDLAVEAVELMGFQEIQFDYVRFPDNTRKHEKAGTIDFRNTYGETKAQAVQRFLMYAADILHEHGAYVSADVYGESAFAYVTAYGQYWPAISNVVDVISGMPYPDHFGPEGEWRPWEHPYEMLLSWGKSAMSRQSETPTPAAVRTWIQAYNAIREPYNTYGPDEVYAQIRGLRDSGCTGGYMTWNARSSLDKYTRLIPAFAPPEGE